MAPSSGQNRILQLFQQGSVSHSAHYIERARAGSLNTAGLKTVQSLGAQKNNGANSGFLQGSPVFILPLSESMQI